MTDIRVGPPQPSNQDVAETQTDPSALQPDQVHPAPTVGPTGDENSSWPIHEGDHEIDQPLAGESPSTTSEDSRDSGAPSASQHSHRQSQEAAEENSGIPRQRSDWRSWKSTWWFNSILFLIEVCFIVAIIVLDQLSVRNDGIATVPTVGAQSSFKVANIRVNYALLWTSLPNLIFSLYSFTWAAAVAASFARQPFIELCRGSNLRRTIMLDYQLYPQFYNWVVALKHRHFHIAGAMLLSLIVSIGVVPLSAHLLLAAPSADKLPVPVSFTTIYNNSVDVTETNLQPYIDIATAVHAYGSTPPAWMTTEYAFAPFFTSSSGSSSTNLSATTSAYSAHLECQRFDTTNMSVSYSDLGSDDSVDQGTVRFQFVDRLCSVHFAQGVFSTTPLYAFTWSFECIDQDDNRLGMLVGSYSASSPNRLTDLSLVSCISSYSNTTGVLTVSHNDVPSLTTNYVAFSPTPNKSTTMRPAFYEGIEGGINQYTLFIANTALYANSVGYTILSTAKRLANFEGKSGMAPDMIQNATERVFTTIYAALVTSEILTPTAGTTLGSGELVTSVNRLFVTRWVAIFILVMYLLLLASHLTLWIYTARNQTVLSEEPMGVLGHALLLGRGDGDDVEAAAPDEAMDVAALVARVRERRGSDVEVRKTLKEGFDVDRAKCSWDEEKQRIVVESLSEKSPDEGKSRIQRIKRPVWHVKPSRKE